jgi:flagellar assembly protein FliH
MMAELEREMQARAQAAYQQGRSEGEAAGVQQAAQRVDGTVAQLANLMRELGSHKARLRMELEEDTVKLAIAIARRVLNRELATDPDVILGLVKAAFAKLNAREAIRLRVSPPDAAVLQQHRPKLDLPPALEIAGDTSLGVGSVIFETTRGQLDASVDTQLGEIERGLADVMHRKSGMKEIR